MATVSADGPYVFEIKGWPTQAKGWLTKADAELGRVGWFAGDPADLVP